MTTLVYITAAGEDLIRVFELDSAGERQRLEEIIREQSPTYHLGTPLD